ncbi:MAG: M23 family metallopeptidase, partial [Pseudomonadota bacterium]
MVAVDLATPEQEPNAQVVSVFDGEALVHTGCDNNDNNKFNNNGCGYGFGNWVVIFDSESDLVVLNAHLRDVRIKDGERVRKGQVIGEEGKTGAAGHRHLYFSVHRNIWKITPDLFKKYSFWLPPSCFIDTPRMSRSGADPVDE